MFVLLCSFADVITTTTYNEDHEPIYQTRQVVETQIVTQDGVVVKGGRICR